MSGIEPSPAAPEEVIGSPVNGESDLRAGRALAILLAFLGTQFVFGILAGVIAAAYYEGQITNRSTLVQRVQSVTIMPVTIVTYLVGGWLVYRMSKGRSERGSAARLQDFGWSRGTTRSLITCACIGLILSVAFLPLT